MKLYHSPGTCAMSPYITLREAGLPFELVPVDLKAHRLPDGADYYAVNPKGSVPALELDNGERLTEGPVIVQYIADQVPEKKLAPPGGTMARYRLQEWLNFITSELHKGFSPLFNPAMPEEGKAVLKAKLADRLKWVDGQLANRPYLMGDTLSVADPYLFTVARWSKGVGLDTSGLNHLNAYLARLKERPSVQSALQAEQGRKS